MVRSLALKLDLGFFEGSGEAPEIKGLKNVSGIQVVDDGAAEEVARAIRRHALRSAGTLNRERRPVGGDG
jgi:hypothetical protein